MTVQSSFLIRCLLSASADPTSGRAFSVQHIQTGAEFRSATLAEVTQWMADQNLKYLSEAIYGPSNPHASLEDLT
jgi:hypothetical protein